MNDVAPSNWDHESDAPFDRPGHGTSSTDVAWALALLPIAAAVVIVVAAFALRDLNILTVIAVSLLLAPLGLPLAVRDQRYLMARGYRQPTSRHLGLVPAGYLFLRGNRCVREQFEGLGPLFVHIAVSLLLFGCVTIFWPWIMAAIYLGQRLA